MSEKVMTKAAYCVRAVGGKYADDFKAGGYAAIGWMPDEDLSGIEAQSDPTALGAIYDSAHPSEGKARRGQGKGQIARFLWATKTGDAVVTPKHPSEQCVLVGVASSGYYYEATPDDCPYPHRKKVEWLEEPVLKSYFSVPVQRILTSPEPSSRYDLLMNCSKRLARRSQRPNP